MNGTPRVLNRVLLALVGLFFLAAGLSLAALAGLPAVDRWWHAWAGTATKQLRSLTSRTTLPGQTSSWVWIVVSLGLIVLVVALVALMANQGKGRVGVLARGYGDSAQAPGSGRVTISSAVAEQALKSALADRTDLVSATVTAYEVRGRTGLKIRVLPRQGAAPQQVAADVSALVSALDAVLGRRLPVLLCIGAGARTRFTRAERVR
ncbi:hypothetical protein IV498_09150 [Paenarthrobacter sp. Z7-10]|uniref:hypothetical protein n=1 Tax=Paenarthrobacter sp. Z7-10 TaxID=2787635 RepID=UPI0022A9926A|nr:hypothetical protein [Paenarthrobacter sp. Z7-10]MCZ2403345.1 hypothetical protein [Paenarthrobacter sp. Z7-10]